MEDRGLSDLLSTASKILNSDSHSSNPSDLLSTASKIFNSDSHSSNPTHGKPTSSSSSSSSSSYDAGVGKPQSSGSKPSYNEIYSSAQVVMNAAKHKLHRTEDSSSAEDVDMGKLAGAAGNIIGAVSHYGKFEQTSYGKYAQKAQEYLHSYEVKHGKPGTMPSSQPYENPNLSEQHGHAPSGYTPSSEQGYGRPSSTYATPGHGYSEPSAPLGADPPPGYPDTQQGHRYGHNQGYPESSATQGVAGYPPAGYPTSSGTYKYS